MHRRIRDVLQGHTGSGNDHAGNPNEEGQPHTSTKSHDAARSGKDTGADHAVKDAAVKISLTAGT